MRLLIIIFVMFAGAAALVLWLFPWWLGIPLVLMVAIPLFWIVWKIKRFIKDVKKAFADFIPQEKLQSVAAGEEFRGHGFTFRFPVACDVSQTHVQDFTALLLKPRFTFAGAPKDTLLVASTFAKEELKEKINETIERVCSQAGASRTEEVTPVQFGPLSGERRAFVATKDGKSVQGEAVYLDIPNGSLVWVAMGPEATFDELAAKYRELALLIRRQNDTAIDVQAEVTDENAGRQISDTAPNRIP